MCGLVGSLSRDVVHAATLRAQVERMATALVHRGPDDAGSWVDPANGIALAHRRLAILDLSTAGHQPMHSASGRYVLAFNGEIYNHLDLRDQLETRAPDLWRGHSDTETLLAGFEAWGVEATLQRAVGMFALALWDGAQRTLYLARDRVGEKPLYYGWQRDTLLFGSELKALRRHSAFHAEVDRDALAGLLRNGYVAAPRSIYRGIRKLPAGTFLAIRAGDQQSGPPIVYWSARTVAEHGQAHPFAGDAREATDRLAQLLAQSVRGQMLSDVPLGAFLSGGVDSSTIAAVMQSLSSRPIKTFTIGFAEAGFNEAEHARAVARHLGTEHTELYVTPREAMEVIPALPATYDEPFADVSQIPTCLVARLARQHVTVALSGDAGDELFGGYNRYLAMHRIWRRARHVPGLARRAAGRSLGALPDVVWRGLGAILGKDSSQPALKARKLARMLAAQDPMAAYRDVVTHWADASALVPGCDAGRVGEVAWADLADAEHQMMHFDLSTYLSDDILVKVDRAAMAVSLETRVPFLDHRVIEFAWQLPLRLKIRDGQGKWILRQVLYRHVPCQLIERPKMGFAVPMAAWLRGPLRPWAEALLQPERLRREGFLCSEPITSRWRQHLSGHQDWSVELWDVLSFQSWLEGQQHFSTSN